MHDFAMCGRFDQNDTARVLASSFGWTDAVFDSEAELHLNVSPGTYRPVLHIQDGVRRVDDVFWGYRPPGQQPPCPRPARRNSHRHQCPPGKTRRRLLETLLRAGRGIVCVDGWYEWTGEKGSKQPWHIHRRTARPCSCWRWPSSARTSTAARKRASCW
jgi:putative SOS response-associated peptidase YedK